MNNDYVSFDVDRLRQISITEVASRFGKLLRKGVRYVMNCPWHDDTHPSLTLYDNPLQGSHCHCYACGHHDDVIGFAMRMLNCDFREACAWLSHNFGIPMHESRSVQSVSIKVKPRNTPSQVDYTYIPMDFVDQHISANSSFCKALLQVIDSHLVKYLVEQYKLGTYEYSDKYCDDVIFPSIDEQGRVHNLKLQSYCCNLASLDFLHCDHSHVVWLGKELSRQGIVASDAVFDNKCLFGAHRLRQFPSSKVALVESPKNAIIGAAFSPDLVWVATGSKSMLCKECLNALRGRDVIAYPDLDATDEWAELLDSFHCYANFVVSDFCRRASPPNRPKYDIADYFIEEFICPF